ncbi:MAG TPA: 2OG-Fe(II) oxygenase [Candidatus Binataceae bacterium]
MPSLKFFRQAGLFVVPGFLDPKFVADLCAAMTVAPAEKGRVVESDGLEGVDEKIRKVESIVLPREIRADLKKRLAGLLPQLEKHFKMQLGGCESPGFLIYRPGDFYTPHKDGGSPSGKNQTSRQRRVSVVIFLNRESPEPEEGAYGQGRLTFYGLLKDKGPDWERCPLPLSAEPGLLVAFPSQMIHGVTPVSHGQRLTVVTWFYASDPETKSETVEPPK